MPKVTLTGPFETKTVEVAEGATLLEAAEEAGAQVGHVCGGVCACSTCHVWVRQGLESLSGQEDDEMDRLDQAFDVKPSSRLACQARVGRVDVEVQVTQESLSAYMDENPQVRKALESEGKWPLKRGV